METINGVTSTSDIKDDHFILNTEREGICLQRNGKKGNSERRKEKLVGSYSSDRLHVAIIAK